MNSSPVIFLAFANDFHNSHRFLEALEPEKVGIQESLGNFFAEGGIVYTAPSSHPEWMLEDILHFHNDLVVFHFSGHANGTHLQLEDPADEQTSLHKDRLRDLLRSMPKLQLIVLNACATSGQVQVLKDIGIPAVIATHHSVSDDLAHRFGIHLYQGMGKGLALGEAFDKALAIVDPANKFGTNYRATFKWEEQGQDFSLNPWALFVADPEVLHWRIPTPQGGAIDLSIQVPKALKRTEFVGREKDLRKLMHLLQRESSVLLLNGLGGIGKTTLAKEYVYRHQNEYRHIAWVNVLHDPHASDTSSGSAYSAIANHTSLFAQLGIPFNTEISEEDRFKQVVAEMNKREGPNLLVIDNAGSSILAIHEELPKAPRWKILTTSRLELDPFTTYYLDELSLEEAERLFTTLNPKGKNHAQDVQDLLRHIGCHTLTIELLARLCEEYPSILPAGVLKRLKDKQFEQFAQSVWSHHSKREVAVYGYLMAAFSISQLTEAEQQQLTQWAVLPSVFVDGETLIWLFNVDAAERMTLMLP
ncbi:MAG: CHAT domain-containing protein [Bacteroidia bacterium]